MKRNMKKLTGILLVLCTVFCMLSSFASGVSANGGSAIEPIVRGYVEHRGTQTSLTPDTENHTTSVRFLGAVNGLDLAEVGFRVTATYKASATADAVALPNVVDKSTAKVYTSVLEGDSEVVAASALGCAYLYALTVEGVPIGEGVEVVFSVTPYSIATGAEKDAALANYTFGAESTVRVVNGVVVEEKVASALRVELMTDRASYGADGSGTLGVRIVNQTALEQTNVAVGVSAPAGISIANNKVVVASIPAGKSVTTLIPFELDAAAVGADATGYVQKTAGVWYSDYSKSFTFEVAGEQKALTALVSLAPKTVTNLQGKVGVATLNTNGSKIAIDDIVVTSNSNGAVLYSNNFDGTNPTADLTFINHYGNAPTGYDFEACWTLTDENGNKILFLDPGGNYHGMGILYGQEGMRDITYTFKLKDTDGGVQLAKPLFGVFGDTTGFEYGYQWVVGGWSNTKTILQHYQLKSTGATERPNVGSAVAVPSFPYNTWIEIKIVVGADYVECYADGVLMIRHEYATLNALDTVLNATN